MTGFVLKVRLLSRIWSEKVKNKPFNSYCHFHSSSKMILFYTLRFSTQAMKMDSLDPNPRSRFNVVSCGLHAAHRLRSCNYWTVVLTHFPGSVTQHSVVQIRIKTMWGQRGLWIRILDPHPRSSVKSPMVACVYTLQTFVAREGVSLEKV